ncbi:MAG: hypothetical protein PHX78_00015 [bacterium]|nr:hypothetical protein [bacterium]
MRKLFYLIILITGIYFMIMPLVKAQEPNVTSEKTQSRLFDLENIFKDKGDQDKIESNIRLKMVTRVTAGVVLIVGILSTIAVQFKVIGMGLGTVTEKPETLGGLIILMLLPESIVLLSFVISTLLILL